MYDYSKSEKMMTLFFHGRTTSLHPSFFFFSFLVFKYLSIESGVTVLMRIPVHDEVEFNIT